jgi:hypothetical protein
LTHYLPSHATLHARMHIFWISCVKRKFDCEIFIFALAKGVSKLNRYRQKFFLGRKRPLLLNVSKCLTITHHEFVERGYGCIRQHHPLSVLELILHKANWQMFTAPNLVILWNKRLECGTELSRLWVVGGMTCEEKLGLLHLLRLWQEQVQDSGNKRIRLMNSSEVGLKDTAESKPRRLSVGQKKAFV